MEEVAFGFKPSGILSNCLAVSEHPQGKAHGTHHIGIHIGMDCPVRVRVVPCSDKNGIALSDRYVQLPNWIRFDISLRRRSAPKYAKWFWKPDPVDLNNAHFVTVNPEVHSGESTSVNNLNKARAPVVSDTGRCWAGNGTLTRRR